MSATKKVTDLINLTFRLTSLLKRENSALKNNQDREVKRMLKEKITLGRIYESRLLTIEEQPELLSEIDPELLLKLKTSGDKLSVEADENGKLLKIVIEANRRVVDTIAEAVRDAAPSAGTYSAVGRRGGSIQPNKKHTVAISIDQNL